MNLHQAYLWIGPHDELRSRAVSFVQKILCKKEGCGQCSDCITIKEQRHYALTWLAPENYYTVKQLEPVFKTVSFALDPGKHHFIVLERADLFNKASANSLLKSLEEPPPGYHYILLAPRTEGILPTIKSRCVIEISSGEAVTHRLVSYFTEYQVAKAPELMKEIAAQRVQEREIHELLDACMQYWHESYKKAVHEGNQDKVQQARAVQEVIQAAQNKPPMPGSSKLFLKNLFLQLSLVC